MGTITVIARIFPVENKPCSFSVYIIHCLLKGNELSILGKAKTDQENFINISILVCVT